MSREQLIELIQAELDNDSDFSSRRERQVNTAKKGNSVFAENVGGPVFEYLDTVYFERVAERVRQIIDESVTDVYEERITKLENEITVLKEKVK